ncbi:MAG: stalk domain-containing protein [Lachnospirales bacterium]
MKKLIITAGMICALASANVYANVQKDVSYSSTAVSMTIPIYIDDVEVAKGYITKSELGKNVYMVPLRQVNDILEFKTKWNKDKTMRISTDERYVTIKMNLDEYVDGVLHLENKTSPVPYSLGSGPKLVGDTTYVPATLYEHLVDDETSVVIKNKAVRIGEAPDYGSLTPPIECETLEELQETVGYELIIPTPPKDYELYKYIARGDIGEISYKKGTDTIVYRMAPGDEDDISGNEVIWRQSSKITIRDMEILMQGEFEMVKVATWKSKNYTYSIVASKALTPRAIRDFIK